jgi:ABC-type oligopeptide transport system, ATPase component
VLNLLGDLKARGLGILFITHDLSLGNYISDTTVILRRGCVVEMGATEKVFGDPRHPYTQSLLASVPLLHSKWGEGKPTPATNEHAPVDAPDDSTIPALVAVADDHLVAAH